LPVAERSPLFLGLVRPPKLLGLPIMYAMVWLFGSVLLFVWVQHIVILGVAIVLYSLADGFRRRHRISRLGVKNAGATRETGTAWATVTGLTSQSSTLGGAAVQLTKPTISLHLRQCPVHYALQSFSLNCTRFAHPHWLQP
jgi:type IV secretory pathway VirB3-like protein